MIDTKLLRQKILDLAIRGKLVPQDPKDEPASELLKKIKAEKEALIKAGNLCNDAYRKQFISQFPPSPNEAGEDFKAQYNQKWLLITGQIMTVFQRLQGGSRAHVISIKGNAIFGTLHQFAFEQKMFHRNQP